MCCLAPPEHEAQDISVRVMSPKSVLISWVDPAVEMEKVAPGASRWALLKCQLTRGKKRKMMTSREKIKLKSNLSQWNKAFSSFSFYS